ncbi:MAG: Phosphoglycerate kinase, partial [Parcubacteria group bacterium GW2011_GWA2_40_8]
MDLPNINQLELDGKRVLLRVDFNVPFFKIDRIPTEADISDDFRIRAVVPTIKLIIEKGGIPIILSHLGRPKGKRDVALS